MIRLDRLRSRLTLDADDLPVLIRLLVDPSGGAEVPPSWVDDGLVIDGKLDDNVAAIVGMVVAPVRATSIQRLGASHAAPLTVGLGSSGNAVVTEPVDNGRIEVTAFPVGLLPSMLLHAVHVDVAAEPPLVERSPTSRTLRAFDAWRSGGDIDESALTGAVFPDEVGVPAFVWRAGGAWRGHEIDTGVTVADCGSTGLWLVEHESVTEDSGVDERLRFEPCSPRDAAIRLGDTVSGRTAPVPAKDLRPGSVGR